MFARTEGTVFKRMVANDNDKYTMCNNTTNGDNNNNKNGQKKALTGIATPKTSIGIVTYKNGRHHRNNHDNRGKLTVTVIMTVAVVVAAVAVTPTSGISPLTRSAATTQPQRQ